MKIATMVNQAHLLYPPGQTHIQSMDLGAEAKRLLLGSQTIQILDPVTGEHHIIASASDPLYIPKPEPAHECDNPRCARERQRAALLERRARGDGRVIGWLSAAFAVAIWGCFVLGCVIENMAAR